MSLEVERLQFYTRHVHEGVGMPQRRRLLTAFMDTSIIKREMT